MPAAHPTPEPLAGGVGEAGGAGGVGEAGGAGGVGEAEGAAGAGVVLDTREGLDPDELPAVEALLSVVAANDGSPPIDDQQRLALTRPDPAAPPVSMLASDRMNGAVLGYGQASPSHGGWTIELAVTPGHRGEGLSDRLLGAGLDAAARRGGGLVRLWLRQAGPGTDALAGRFGLRPERDLHQLRVPLPLDAPARDLVAVRAFRPGVDDQEWLAVNNRAFAGHPEQSDWTLHDLEEREAEPWFDPAGFLVRDEDGRLAAFCWTKVHRESVPVMGEIYVIGVDPDFHGRGLGRALTVAGLRHLAGEGVAVGMLYVDGDNAVALRMYDALGFTLHHTDRSYRGTLTATH